MDAKSTTGSFSKYFTKDFLFEFNTFISPGSISYLQLEQVKSTTGAWVPLKSLSQGTQGLWNLYTVSKNNNNQLKVAKEIVELIHVEGDNAYISGTISTGDMVVSGGAEKVIENQILKANVHLNPSDEIQTTQTGTRHRTAHRVSVETALDVIAVSDESGLIKVFSGDDVNELEESSMILGRVNESLQSIDRTRRRFDDAVFELGELEIENSITNQQVLEVIQRGELLDRLSKQVKKNSNRWITSWANRNN